MEKELDKKLCADFPNLYRQRVLPMSETCMCWGFPGDGWFDIIYRLSAALEKLDAGIVAVQVKEKFGGLRFYVKGVRQSAMEEAHRLIGVAEGEAARTCEACGKPGEIRFGGWTKVRCDECQERYDAKRGGSR